MCRLLIVAVTLVGLAQAAGGNEIRVTFRMEREDAKCGSTRVVATSGAGERHEWDARVPESVAIDIPLNTFWTLDLASPACWSRPVQLSPGIDVPATTIKVFTKTTLRSDIGFDGPATAVRVAVRLAEEETTEYTPVSCRRAGAVICEVPSALVDLRVSADGYGAKYLWNINVPREGATTDAIVLRAGSTIAGRVAGSDGERGMPGATAVALKAIDVDPPRIVRSEKTTPRGWFQFDGVPSGRYLVTASKAGFAAAEVPVTLSDPRSIELPLMRLERFLDLVAFISPPSDPTGDPWGVSLDRRPSDSTHLRRITASRADVAGRWETKGIAPGEYIVSVLDSSGNRFRAERVTVNDGQTTVSVTIPLVRVVGTLTRRDEGIRAQLEWSGRDGTRILLESDEEGRFAGTLPREGQWWVDIRRAESSAVQRRGPIDVHADDSGSAKIEIALSDGSLRGTVRDESGKPASAVVFLQRPGKRLLEAETDEQGAFAFDDLEPGQAVVEAQSARGESGRINVTISRTKPDELEIVVRERATISGSISTSMGYPLTGAYVRAFGSTFTDRRETRTGPAGEFALKVPHGAAMVTIAVLPSDGPVFLRTLSVAESRHRIVAPPTGGKLVFRGGSGWPFLVVDGAQPVSASNLTYPLAMGAPREITPDGIAIELEPRTYMLCVPPLHEQRCIPAVIRPGESTSLNLTEKP